MSDSTTYTSSGIEIPTDELKFQAIRSSGPGGQHVNKVSTGIRLLWDVHSSRMGPASKQKVLQSGDAHLNQQGFFILNSTNHRSQRRNREDAIQRFIQWLDQCLKEEKERFETKPSRASQRRRMQRKRRRAEVKQLRRRPPRPE